MRTLFLLLIATKIGMAQPGLELEAYGLLTSQDRTLKFLNVSVEDYSAKGYSAYLLYSHEFPAWKITATAGAGAKRLSFEGDTDHNQQFKGNTLKLGMILGLRYQLMERWDAGVRFEMENNRDKNKFRISTTDLLRYNLQIITAYEFLDKLAVSAFYSNGLYPMHDNYLLYNPVHQFGFGLRYEIL